MMAGVVHLTPELIAQIVSASPRITYAASKAGVGRRTLYDWLRRGESGERPYVDLYRGWEAMRLSRTGTRRADWRRSRMGSG